MPNTGLEEAKKVNSQDVLLIAKVITCSLLLFLIDMLLYNLLAKTSYQYYWVAIPILVLLMSIALKSVFNLKFINTMELSICSLICLVLMFLVIKIPVINKFYFSNYEIISALIVLLFLIFLVYNLFLQNKEAKEEKDKQSKMQLFNLFYINTPKAYEIAMLIDNKLPKVLEKEQVSERLLKKNSSLNFGKENIGSLEAGVSIDESDKKRVYESFDVKNTKSTMLKKIYRFIEEKQSTRSSEEQKNKNFSSGNLVIFRNIELQQRNVDDSMLLLNILQDSKIKSEETDNVEIDLNKMMDKMLDGMTVDYIFKDDSNQEYLIQLPYKSTNNFENGYLFNDLQLGKLSLVGIFRDEIDFSKKESSSSKMMQILSNEYNKSSEPLQTGMQTSIKMEKKETENPFELNHEKLNGTKKLIDVIAIIQELNITDGEII